MHLTAEKPAAMLAPDALPALRKTTARLQKACEDFEALFAKQLLASAQTSPTGDTLFGSDAASSVVDEMFHTHLAQTIGRTRGLGLADMLARELQKTVQIIEQATADQSSGAPDLRAKEGVQ